MTLQWYAVHTYSGHEAKARLSLQERVKASSKEDCFGEILIPTESVVEMVRGKKRTMTRKFYPGYMFVQMELNDETFLIVKNTPKITGFLGGQKPVPVKDDEIAGINKQMTEGATKLKPRVSFESGETVRVTDGPFSNFIGVVEEVKPEKQKLWVRAFLTVERESRKGMVIGKGGDQIKQIRREAISDLNKIFPGPFELKIP